MKTLYAALLGLSLALQAQQPVNYEPPTRLSREELKDLTGPIALYPDPLVALILPASTLPGDLVIAARFVDSGDDPSLADSKPWDDSIKGLTRYPDTLKWLDENLEWTTQLGDAYLAQPEDVMDAIQELRAQAQALGNLQDNQQQLILRDEERIRIVPADPEYIYVPQYVPEVVYYERPVQQPLLTFGLGYLVGSWLRYDFDWHNRRLYCGDWQRHDGDYRHDYDRNDRRGDVRINNYMTNYQVWNVDKRRRSAAVSRVAVTVERGVAYRQSHPQSLDERRAKPSNGGNDRPDHHDSRFALPKPKSTHAAVAGRESVRRALSPDNDKRSGNDKPRNDGKPDRSKDDKSPTTRGPSNDKKDDPRGDGRFTKPKTDAPKPPTDGKRGDNDKPNSPGKPPTNRGPSNDKKDDNRGDGRTMKPKTDAPKAPTDGKRSDNDKPRGDGKPDSPKDGKPPANRGPSNDKKDDNRGDGRTMKPKTDAPNAPDASKRGDNGKPNNDGKPPTNRGPSNDKKDDNRGDGRTMKPKTDAPKAPEASNRSNKDKPRPDNKPDRSKDDKPQANRGQPARPAPKPKASTPEHRDAPKPKAAAPARREEPKPRAAAPKPAAPASKPKAPASDKDKKDKDKDKDKKH